MDERNSRTIRLIGKDNLTKLQAAKVLIVGVGGVGSYAAEAIARAGVGTIAVMDGDQVAASNLNRQLIALTSNIGKNKAEVMATRIKDINPDCNIITIPNFYISLNSKNIENPSSYNSDKSDKNLRKNNNPDLSKFDWVIDAIDDVDAKVELIKNANEQGVNIISSMGTAGKLDTDFRISDISKTSVCPLAKVIRKRLREIGIEHLAVVYSEEKANITKGELGTISYVPATAGLKLSEHVIKEIIK